MISFTKEYIVANEISELQSKGDNLDYFFSQMTLPEISQSKHFRVNIQVNPNLFLLTKMLLFFKYLSLELYFLSIRNFSLNIIKKVGYRI